MTLPRALLWPGRGLLGRRAVLAGAGLLSAPPALAREHGGALATARRAGRLRVGIGMFMQLPARPPLPPDAPPRDAFTEAFARRLAGRLGLRAEIEYLAFGGETLAWLSDRMLDVALGPPFTRSNSREAMFARPHLALELVVLAPPEARPRRRLSEWAGSRLAVIPPYLTMLEDLGQPVELIQPVPVANLLELEQALLDGRASGAVLTSLQALAVQRRHPERPLVIRTALATFPFSAAVPFGEHDLLRAVDQAVMLLLDSGEAAMLFREAHGMPFPPLEASR